MILDHKHGVNQQSCDHPACRAAVTRYRKRWQYDVAHGRHRTTPPDRTRLHVAALEGAGWSLRAIAEASGLSPTTVSRVARGLQGTVSRTTARAILSIDPDTLPERGAGRGFVARVGTVRRIQALMRMGWSHRAMGAHVGEPTQWTVNRLHQRGRWVTRDVHEQVAAMYRELSHHRGPSERTARAAERLGYPGPLDWDDIDRDPEPLTPWVLNRKTGEWVDPEGVPYVGDDAARIHDYRMEGTA